MNWQCPRCETFNRAAEAYCGVCDIAKPKRRATKTATKKTDSSLFAPKDLTRSDLPVKPTRGEEPLGFKVIDRRSSALAKSAGSSKPVTMKPSEPPISSTPTGVQPSATPGGAIVDLLLWLVVIVYNVYVIHDLWFVQKLSVVWFVVGMVFTNMIGLAILGGILGFIKWLITPTDSAK